MVRTIDVGEVATAGDADPPAALVTHAPPRISTGKLDALTSLRFPAATLAVVGHTFTYFGIAVPLLSTLPLNQGVSFFFILSGFILAYVYPSLSLRSGTRFLVARFARIWPMYTVALFLSYFLLPASLYPEARGRLAMLFNLTLVQNWQLQFFPSVNPVSWSLSVEMFFYVMFPFLLWRWRQTWQLKLALAFLCTCFLIFLVDRLQYTSVGVPPVPYDFVIWSPLARLFEFVLGMATAQLWRFLHARTRLSRGRGTLVELAVVAVAVAAFLSTNPLADWLTRTHFDVLKPAWEDAPGYLPWFGHAASWWLRSSGLVCLPFAALILVMALESGWVSRVLAFPPLVLLGEISYSTYLLHAMMVQAYATHLMYFVSIPEGLRYPIYLIAVLLASYLGWAVIEMPFRRLIVGGWDRVFGGRGGARAGRGKGAAQGQGGKGQAWSRVFTTPSWRISIAIILIGGFWFATLPVAVPNADDFATPQAADIDRPLDGIFIGKAATQRFIATGTSIRAIAIQVATYQRVNHGTVDLLVQAYANGQWQDLAMRTIAKETLSDNAYYTLTFTPPLTVAKNQPLRMTLRSDNDASNAITWWMNPTFQPTGYTLTYGGLPQQGTAVFGVTYGQAPQSLIASFGFLWGRLTIFLVTLGLIVTGAYALITASPRW